MNAVEGNLLNVGQDVLETSVNEGTSSIDGIHGRIRRQHDRLGKRVVDQNWADYEEESNEEEYVWQEGQWCPGGLTRSHKRRVQRLRNKELEQAQASSRPQVWRAKRTVDRGNHRLIFKWIFCYR